jgi:hypothetical protein
MESYSKTFKKEHEEGYIETFHKAHKEGYSETFHKERMKRDITLLTEGKGKQPLKAARDLMNELKDKHPELKKELELFAEKAKQKAIFGEIEYNKFLIRQMNGDKAEKYGGYIKGYSDYRITANKRIEEVDKQRKLNDEELQKKLREALM